MKVVQLLTQATGGPNDATVDLSVELGRRGHDVLVVMADGPAARRAAAAGLRVSGAAPASVRDTGGLRALAALLRDERPDVLHCQDRRAGLVGRLAARALRLRRTVYTLHGVPDSLSSLVPGNAPVAPRRRGDGLRYLRTEAALGRLGDVVVVPTQALRQYLLEHVGLPDARVAVVPNAVDTERFRPGPRCAAPGRLQVVWLGALVPTKAVHVLLRAVAAVDGVDLVLAGTGELEEPLRAEARRLDLDGRATWAGWVDDPADLLSRADALALPSLAENQPMAVLQAMASGAACVATRVGGLPETVTDGVDGLLVPAGDADALAAALTRLRDDVGLRTGLGRQARATALERFAVPTAVDRLLEVYA